MPKQVVVIGGGQGGLTAAIYARLRGHDVLLLEKQGAVGGKAAKIQIGEYRLDPGPSIIILPRIYEQVFRDAGRRMEDYLSFRRLDPITRVFFEDQTWDLPAGRAESERLIGDIASQDRSAFTQLFRRLDCVAPHVESSVFSHSYDHAIQLMDRHLISIGTQINVRATYRQLVDGWFKSPLLRAFFYGFPSYGGQTFDSRSIGGLLIPYYMLTEGVFYPEGGVAAIPESFAKLAIELGVSIRTDVKVVRLELSGKRIVAAVTSDGERIEADVFISNVDATTTGAWLDRKENGSPSFSYFTLHWGIRRRFPELEHHTLLIPAGFERGFEDLYRNRRFPEPPIVYLNAIAKDDVAPSGCTNLFAVVTCPSKEDHLDWSAIAAPARRRCMEVMSDFGIEVPPEELDFERMQSPEYFEAEHGNYRGSLYGLDEKLRPFGGMFPGRVIDRQFTNLYYCGGSVQPGAGLPMVTLSGRFAAAKL